MEEADYIIKFDNQIVNPNKVLLTVFENLNVKS